MDLCSQGLAIINEMENDKTNKKWPVHQADSTWAFAQSDQSLTSLHSELYG